MGKKALYVASCLKLHINVFHLPALRMLQESGYETYVAAHDDFADCGEERTIPGCDRFFEIGFQRSPFRRENIRAYRELKRIVDENGFDLIHCHTPVAAVLTRFAARKARKRGTRVVYTAHGFHFFKGAPLKNWLLYYPAEWLCAHLTDVLIVIDREDYALARAHMHARKVVYLPGVGVDLGRSQRGGAVSVREERAELGVPEGAVWLLAVGELSRRKDHETAIRAVAQLENVYLTIAGEGELRSRLERLIDELGVSGRVRLLGFRRDVPELCGACDGFVFPSRQEGLPVALIEAMAAGLPCVASRIRGNVDLLDGEGGYLVEPGDVRGFADAIGRLAGSREDRERMGAHNREAVKPYAVEHVLEALKEIYQEADGPKQTGP